MTKNIGTFDRIIRLGLGIILVAVALVWISILWIKVFVILLALFCFYEALSSWCLFYQLIGKNTCPIE